MRIFWITVVLSVISASSAGSASKHDPIIDANRNYQKYQAAVEQTGQKLPRSSKAVSQALKRLTEHKPNELGSGWIAEGARQVSRNQVFKSGVIQAVLAAGGVDQFAAQLETDPNSVMKIPGAGNGMRAAFNNIKLHDQYYDWLSGSLTAIARGNKAKLAPSFGAVVIPRPKPSSLALAKKVVSARFLKAPPHSMGQRNNLSVVGRMMVLAALDIAGTTRTDQGISKAEGLLNSSPMTGCLSLARQNLQQCLAASRGKSEKQFCAGQHAIGEVSGCFDWILPPNY